MFVSLNVFEGKKKQLSSYHLLGLRRHGNRIDEMKKKRKKKIEKKIIMKENS